MPGPSGIKLPLLRHFFAGRRMMVAWLQNDFELVPKRQNIPRPSGCRGRYRIIIGVQVDRVVRKKRPNVELGDVGYGYHDAMHEV